MLHGKTRARARPNFKHHSRVYVSGSPRVELLSPVPTARRRTRTRPRRLPDVEFFVVRSLGTRRRLAALTRCECIIILYCALGTHVPCGRLSAEVPTQTVRGARVIPAVPRSNVSREAVGKTAPRIPAVTSSSVRLGARARPVVSNARLRTGVMYVRENAAAAAAAADRIIIT